MKTRIYYAVTTHKEHNEEGDTSARHHIEGDVEHNNGHFEVEAEKHKREDGKSDIHFKGKVTLKDEDYYKYIAKYGHHFNKALSEFIVDKISSSNSKVPYDKVEEILKQSDEELDDSSTIADLHYIANVIKARHSSATVKSDAHVVMLGIEYLNDPNKSEGELFCEWFDWLKRKDKKISWNNFI